MSVADNDKEQQLSQMNNSRGLEDQKRIVRKGKPYPKTGEVVREQGKGSGELHYSCGLQRPLKQESNKKSKVSKSPYNISV